ncbi:PP2C family protein-serine/threonine phosphatase [Actinoallomurus rhizosphaericola]|uniref:PP2C family protein-serine/threonine phosphatase n=1 Tax=Actinoallomurus rhizosphaericola TaxID=2952536 RepID=UPI00209374BB|nr:GAF domain-containing SpoIIE family protein phosphatase [Actinoallomurus rhizosphaericola]MCO5997852.1 SpoIIE family protein phosphatase [Actinoallomurus rhizosphaericola]
MVPRPDAPPNTAEVKLAHIRAITDAALAHMGVEDVLDELLDRVREILEADTAVVLLLDHSGRQLVATAAKGIEEEVYQAVRVPVGKGFAGSVAARREPVIIDDVPTADIVNPLLMNKGLHSLLGVPLVSGGMLLGVMHVGTIRPHRFTGEQVEFMRMAADRVALAARSLLSETAQTAARELQRSLVPAALPELDGVEMAARYSPGRASVGGDWYDVFDLPSGELGIVMGDVAGHGLQAAVIMGRMRSALRSYALETDDPAKVLHKLDRKMQHFEPGAMATVLYAICDPGLERARVSSAGHLPPVLARPGEPTVSLEPLIPSGLVIGADTTVKRHTSTIEIPPGGLVCFYTDGLVERRNASIDDGIRRLCDAVRPDRPEAVCAAVMAALVGREPMQDDVALLAVRRASA